jgi:hypothetical protein
MMTITTELIHQPRTAPDRLPAGPPTEPLRFNQTVDRAVVHRSAVAEVFLTDLREIGLTRLLAGAQLPLTHGYYNDHTGRDAVVDPLLLLECGRQAGICGTHVLGVPLDRVMLVGEFSLRLENLAALVVGSRPVELRIDSEFVPTRVRGGRNATQDALRRLAATGPDRDVRADIAPRVRKGRTTQRLYVGDVPVARHEMEVQFLTYPEYGALRQAQRGSPAPSTADLADPPADGMVAPARVGRVSPLNVVLAGPAWAGAGVSARVAPWPANRALFDHEYDHLPAMTLTEAARQLALLAAAGPAAPTVPAGLRVCGLTARYLRFAELDQPVRATAELPAGRFAGVAVGTIRVTFTQEDTVIAETTVELTRDVAGEDRT